VPKLPGEYSAEIYSGPEKITEIQVEAAQPATVGKPISRCLKVESILKISNQLSVIPLEN